MTDTARPPRPRARRRRTRRRAALARPLGLVRDGQGRARALRRARARGLRRFRDLGFRVFADLKLHDIPTTVGPAPGPRPPRRRLLNFHAAGGDDMLRAGVDGLREGARDAGVAPPIALGVTVLTSDADTNAFDATLQLAPCDAGCDGVVCAGTRSPLAPARDAHDGARASAAGGDTQDQARVVTPARRDRATAPTGS